MLCNTKNSSNLIKCFYNEEKIIQSYKKNEINIHTYLWLFHNNDIQKNKLINIKKKAKNIKKLKFIV